LRKWERRVLEEKGWVGNQKNLNESIRPFDDAQDWQAQDRLAGFFDRAAVQSFTEAGEKCTGHL